MDYFRSCSLSVSVVFIIFYFLSNAVQAGNSFWLSKWTQDAEMETQNNLPNSTNSSSQKYLDLGVYSALGILQCKIILNLRKI